MRIVLQDNKKSINLEDKDYGDINVREDYTDNISVRIQISYLTLRPSVFLGKKEYKKAKEEYDKDEKEMEILRDKLRAENEKVYKIIINVNREFASPLTLGEYKKEEDAINEFGELMKSLARKEEVHFIKEDNNID